MVSSGASNNPPSRKIIWDKFGSQVKEKKKPEQTDDKPGTKQTKNGFADRINSHYRDVDSVEKFDFSKTEKLSNDQTGHNAIENNETIHKE